jgi:hypothetical protein
MIGLKQGDILRANAEALVNTVNCVGVMGRGLAIQFKKVSGTGNHRKPLSSSVGKSRNRQGDLDENN